MHDQADFAALLRHQLAQAGMHGVQGGKVVVTARDTGLVGGHGDGPAGLAQTGDGRDGAGDGDPFLEGFDVVVGVLVDDSVAVENQ
ncbi:hypothetical protein D9M73_254520 [compost metagenome]